MKPLFFLIAFAILTRVDGARPVSTYTFADPCTPFVTVNAVPDKQGCYFFTASNGLLPGQNQGTYTWRFSETATATGSQVAHCYSPEILTVVHTATVTYFEASCGAQGIAKVFTVSVSPVPNGSCIVGSPEVLQSAESVTVLGGIAIPEMMRTFNYGDSPEYINNPEHTYTGCGPFVISIKSWDMNLPGAICYAYHAVNFVCKGETTGLTEEHQRFGKVYPNPCQDRLFIETKKVAMQVTVIDVLGRTLSLDSETGNQKIAIQTQGLDHGIFFVKIDYLDRSAEVFKIMKD